MEGGFGFGISRNLRKDLGFLHAPPHTPPQGGCTGSHAPHEPPPLRVHAHASTNALAFLEKACVFPSFWFEFQSSYRARFSIKINDTRT
ncbi:hypothetical protein ACFX16_019357 [Malus domestica]